jgi:hypothetical protein
MRDKIADRYSMYQWYFHIDDERLHPENRKLAYAFADQILELINTERCVCTYDADDCMLSTGCGKDLYYEAPFEIEYTPFCPCCGKRIEVTK